jgi:predicted MFS family arabinose efflux permease
VLASAWVPQLVLTLYGGVWADRLPRHLVMVATDLAMFAAQATIAVLLLTGSAELWQLVALQVVRGVATAFFFPASTGLLPQVVAPGALQQANALLLLTRSGTAVLGAAATGLIVAAAGSGWAFAFDATTFLASAALLVRLRVPRAPPQLGGGILRELREGWDEFSSRTWVWVIVLSVPIGNLGGEGGFNALGPVVADSELGGAAAWGFILAGDAVGLMIAALFALRFKPGRLLLVGCLVGALDALLLAALAVPTSTAVIVLAAVAGGFGLELFNVLWLTALQQHIPQEKLSRVSSYDALGSYIAIPVGLTIAGPIAAVIGVSATIWAAAGLRLVSCLAPLAVREVRTLRRTSG